MEIKLEEMEDTVQMMNAVRYSVNPIHDPSMILK